MNLRQAFAHTIKIARKTQKLTQEDFGVVSSRTYMSTLERGLKSPTIDKLDEISKTMEMHPASLIVAAYALLGETANVEEALKRIQTESAQLLAHSTKPTKSMR